MTLQSRVRAQCSGGARTSAHANDRSWLLIGGRTVKEAAGALGLSPRTVEGYLERLKRRFKHPRLLSLVVHLVKAGLVE